MKSRWYKHKIKNLLLVSKIITIHYFEFREGFRARGESHDFWEMVYADRNDLICSVEGKDIVLKEGEAIFHKPNEHHVHSTQKGEKASVVIVSFECKSEAIHILEGQKLAINREHQGYIYSIVSEAEKTFDWKYPSVSTKKMKLLGSPALGGMQCIKNILELLLIGIIRKIDGEAESPAFIQKENFDEFVTNQVIEYLTEHVNGRITIEEICERLNYTKSYLFRQFKSVTGQSIMAYFTSLKIREAKRLLCQTKMTVTEIAAALSFDTPNYFSKTFKRVSGFTPLQYKKLRSFNED